MKKLLIFDAYGTLFSTGTGSLDAVTHILRLQDKEISAAGFYADWKQYHRKHIDECNADIFVPEREIFTKDLRVLYEQYGINRPYEQDVSIMLDSLTGRKLFPEVKQTIEELRKTFRIVIGSTTDTEPLLTNVNETGLIVDEIYTSEMIGKYKPTEEFYKYILSCERYSSKNAVFIGDSLLDDIYGPQAVGISTILVDRGHKYNAQADIQPDYVVTNLSELLNPDL